MGMSDTLSNQLASFGATEKRIMALVNPDNVANPNHCLILARKAKPFSRKFAAPKRITPRSKPNIEMEPTMRTTVQPSAYKPKPSGPNFLAKKICVRIYKLRPKNLPTIEINAPFIKLGRLLYPSV